jgi:hypothetical protein
MTICPSSPPSPTTRLRQRLQVAAGVLLVAALTCAMQVVVPLLLIALLDHPRAAALFAFAAAAWPLRRRLRSSATWLLALVALGTAGASTPPPPLPATLRDTGLRMTATGEPPPGIAAFSPQYPLWSDGADKRRWLQLPPGTFIDASRPDAWVFPRGTRLWKEFSHGGRPVETRYIERTADGTWRFAAYVWNEAGTEAVLAPARGIAALPVREAPLGRYAVPSRTDCLACHASTTVPVLGLGVLQLSADRDPLAPGAKPLRPGELDLRALVARGWVRGLPKELATQPARIDAATPVERAALGYLHANCGHCHNTTAARVPLDLTLAQRAADPGAARAEVLRATLEAVARYQPAGTDGHAVIVAPGRPQASLLASRMQSRHAQVQMPPLGTQVPDPEGLALVQRWIAELDSSQRKETSP